MKTIILSTVLAIASLTSMTTEAKTLQEKISEKKAAWDKANPNGAAVTGPNGYYFRDKNGIVAATPEAAVVATETAFIAAGPDKAVAGTTGLLFDSKGNVIWCPPDDPAHNCLIWNADGQYAFIPNPNF